MKEIQRSIFVLCLDKPVADNNASVQRSQVVGEMLHGGGAHLNSGNRWFDKTLQVQWILAPLPLDKNC